MNKKLLSRIKNQLNIKDVSIANVIKLLDDGNTVPFIARYRKESHGNLDEVQIQEIKKEYQKLQNVISRQNYIIKVIENEGKLSEELKAKIQSTFDPLILEDYYLPFKKKRKSKATQAIELGFDSLLKIIIKSKDKTHKSLINQYLNKHKIQLKYLEAYNLLLSLYASQLNENSKIRQWNRIQFEKYGRLTTNVKKGKEKEGNLYKDYFNYNQLWKKVPSHRVLAMLRAEDKGFISIKLRPDKEKTIYSLTRILSKYSNLNLFAKKAIELAYTKHLLPSIEKEFISIVKEKAQLNSAETFTQNLKTLLISPPIKAQPIIAIDPGIRTGHKLVALSQSGELLEKHNVNYHNISNEQKMQSTIQTISEKYRIHAIAIGNGTGGRDLYNWFNENFNFDLYLVDESGASVYSASDIAREEFPDLDITFRGSISIGRRLQNPLAELIKIDPRSLGIGQYHHDIPIKLLNAKIDEVAELTVNKIGVDLNTASKPLLKHVSGIGETLAENILKYRRNKRAFKSRKELLEVQGLGPKSYEQAAGFLRIPESKNLLDSTNIHPEAYDKVYEIAQFYSLTVDELFGQIKQIARNEFTSHSDSSFSTSYLSDIYDELINPGKDFRQLAHPTHFAHNIKTIQDISVGQRLRGVVSNITDFGAFIDIGIKENGLVHKSEISSEFINSPFEKVKLMQEVSVKVLDVDIKKKRISLSMKR